MRLPLFAAVLTLAGVAVAQPVGRVSQLKDGSGKPVGTVTLTPAPRGVLMKVELAGLAPGWHAIHIHEKGDCSDAAFKQAGGHVHGGTAPVHGLLNPAANDQGDLPNIHVGADGTGKAELFTTMATLGAAGVGQAALLDKDGSAIVVHAKPDDYTTQPIGGAGDRVACGVVS